MHTFIALISFTDSGLHDIKDSPHRADLFLEVAEKPALTSRMSTGPSAATMAS